jgi:predicted MFS family arabinose efflux permease
MIYPAVGLAAAGSSLSIPSLSGMLSVRMSADSQGRLMGGSQVLHSFTAILGPLMAGFVFDQVGVSAPYWIGSGLALAAFILVGRGFRRAQRRA